MHLRERGFRRTGRTLALGALGCLAAITSGAARAHSSAQGTSQGNAQTQLVRQLGTIKTIQGSALKLTTDDGADVNVMVKQGARMLRVEPGEKDLTHAVPLELSDLQVGDRIRVRGQNSPDGKTLVALEVIAIKHLDIQAKRQQEQADWQKRGIGGLVSAVDPSANTIAVSVRAQGVTKTVTLHVASNTVLRRYAPGSVRFDDAKPAPLTQVQPGDQLRARGNRSEDGNDFAAEEVVSGSFRNIAGTITAIDPEAKTLSIADLLSKKPVTVRITAQSQLRKLPQELAAGMAMRLKTEAGARGTTPMASPGASGGPAGATSGGSGAGIGPGGSGPGSGYPVGTPGGGRDFQQVVNRLPLVTLGDFQKGEAIMLVATEGSTAGEMTAITLLGGVEALLAAPRGSQTYALSPWALGGGGEGGGDPNP